MENNCSQDLNFPFCQRCFNWHPIESQCPLEQGIEVTIEYTPSLEVDSLTIINRYQRIRA